jgi:hypothetical protein
MIIYPDTCDDDDAGAELGPFPSSVKSWYRGSMHIQPENGPPSRTAFARWYRADEALAVM